HTAAVRGDNMFDQTQPEAVSVDLRSHHFLTAIKRLENALYLRRRNAHSPIRDLNPNLWAIGGRRRFDAQPDQAIGAAVFHRVAEQVLNRAAKRHAVGVDQWQIGRDFSFDLETAFGELQVTSRDRVFDHLAQFRRPQFVTLSSRLSSGEFQNLLDHSRQPATFVADQLAVASDLVTIVNYAVGQVLRRRADHGQRRAQFVRDSGDELHLLGCQTLGAATGQHDEPDARAQ